MGIFDFFKSKKNITENKAVSENFVEDTNEEIELCTFTEISSKRFFDELSNYGFEPEYWFGAYSSFSSSEKFKIFIGDIEGKGELNFDVDNLLVVGNINAEWLNTEYDNGGGSLFVTGDIICDYFSNYYGKLVIVNGSLLVKKIVNNEFEDSTLTVRHNFATEYYHGIDIWVEAGGKIDVLYGNGYCLPVGYKEPSKECIVPKYNDSISKDFLGIDDVNADSINKLIRERVLKQNN